MNLLKFGETEPMYQPLDIDNFPKKVMQNI